MRRLRMFWLDVVIGWHQGGAERHERAAARHRSVEAGARQRYADLRRGVSRESA